MSKPDPAAIELHAGSVLANLREARIHLQAAPGQRRTICGEDRFQALTTTWTEITCRRCLVARDRAERVKALRRGLEIAMDNSVAIPRRIDEAEIDWSHAEAAVEAAVESIQREDPTG